MTGGNGLIARAIKQYGDHYDVSLLGRHELDIEHPIEISLNFILVQNYYEQNIDYMKYAYLVYSQILINTHL